VTLKKLRVKNVKIMTGSATQDYAVPEQTNVFGVIPTKTAKKVSFAKVSTAFSLNFQTTTNVRLVINVSVEIAKTVNALENNKMELCVILKINASVKSVINFTVEVK
jgi:ribosomal protein L30/L7E